MLCPGRELPCLFHIGLRWSNRRRMTIISENILNCGSQEMTQLLSDVRLPRFYKVRQKFDKTHFDSETIVSVLKQEFEAISVRGQRIAVTAGSRGVANIGLFLKTIVEILKTRGANPFIVPAMGSHGGASAEGQKAILTGYGITEEAMGCPIYSSMEVKKIGKTVDGREVLSINGGRG